MDTYSFFRKMRTAWNTANKTRSEEYLLGGMVALREAEEAFTATPLYNARLEAQTMQAELERVSQDLVEARARNRSLASKNESLLSKLELTQQAEIAASKSLKAALAAAKNTSASAPSIDSVTRQMLLDAKGTEGSLRARIYQLEQQISTNPHTAEGKVFPVAKVFRRFKSILSREELPAEERLRWIAQNVENYECALGGRPSEQWEKLEPA